MIKITLLDNSIREVKKGTKIIDLAKSISPSLAKATTSAIVDGKLVDLRNELHQDCKVQILTQDNEESLEALRHSLWHITDLALSKIRPSYEFAIGAVTAEGFYYDVEAEPRLTEKELPILEKEMKKIINAAVDFTKFNSCETLHIYSTRNKPLHLQTTAPAKHFKLLSLSGTYQEIDFKTKECQRIYGTAFFTKKQLDEHLKILEERKERDHRKLGKNQEIFMINQLAGQGCPTWLANGFRVRKVLEDYFYQTELKYGHQHVITPIVGSVELYKTSGHWENYQENMFPLMERNGEELVLRPMTCPHHMLIFQDKRRSYNELPLRIAENAILHRYEASGALAGLERVRAMNLTDAHIFVTPEQIKDEMKHLWKLIHEVIKKLDLEIHYVELALRGKEGKYHKDDKMWNESEKVLKEVLEELDVEYKAVEDEAAFYGPKIDLQVKTVLGRIITLATLQLDFLLPEKFDLTYINENGEKQRPIVIHRGLVGTYERLISIILEQYKGVFPVWMAPTQVVILPVSNKHHLDYAHAIFDKLESYGIRSSLVDSKERLSYRICEAQTSKIPFQLVIGDNEIDTKKVNVRKYGSDKEDSMEISDFIDLVKSS